MTQTSIRSDSLPDAPYGEEQDSCAIYLSARKFGQSTFGTLKRSLGALVQMGHRTGFVNGEGDGAGVQTDIPRRLWTRKLSQASLRSSLASHPGFWVGHIFIPQAIDQPDLHEQIFSAFDKAGLNPLYQQPGRTRPELLGGNARLDPPAFWQIAGYSESPDLDRRLLAMQTSLEAEHAIHFLSLSSSVVVYKIRGSVETLSRYYPDLQDRNYDTAVVLCHARYSTNTVSNFERAQPFPLMGHNGEINTINRLRLEAEQIGIDLPRHGSDSQDVDRIIHSLCVNQGLDLIEAVETVFPPVPFELDHFPPELRAVYTRIRQSFGPYAQGPAAIIARFNDSIVGSVDALGLRPLWFVETEKEFIFSSERGAIPLEVIVADPRPLGPGEKMAIHLHHGDNPEVLSHDQIRQHVLNKAFQREAPQLARKYWIGWDPRGNAQPETPAAADNPQAALTIDQASAKVYPEVEPDCPACWMLEDKPLPLGEAALSACGWNMEHQQELFESVFEDKEISSLGYDGPLAALSRNRVNLADFFKETVAVVTNPAIDRGREIEVFSTSSLFGASPSIGKAPDPNDRLVTLAVPILTGGLPPLESSIDPAAIAHKYGTLSIEALLQHFAGRTAFLILGVMAGEDVQTALTRLKEQCITAVRQGAQCLLLDDFEVIHSGLGWLDPVLAVSCIDEELRKTRSPSGESLRRRAGLAIRSASIRNLHDIILLSGFGADAINPYAMLKQVAEKTTCGSAKYNIAPETAQTKLLRLFKVGLEKIISTMGCHELRGYGRVCSSIGLAPSIADLLQSPNYFGSEKAGMNWERLNREAGERGRIFLSADGGNRSLPRVDHFYPKIWKKIGQFTRSQTGYDTVLDNYREVKNEIPVALRHVLGFKKVNGTVIPSQVDLTIRDYALPMVISAMSFGSQGEKSFHAYAQAAARLNIICINGEGGELPKLMGLYKRNRGQQVASGRFGVNAEFLNSAAIIEIKIGQGAKPGEGGMLPSYKVTPQVAEARHTPQFVALLSPSNNHDLYSIEDLAQLIEELKVVNPQAKISVKCPVVPGIGVIAVGIAKAGADIINLSGYDGGTGAARKHALQYVGLPAEIGVIQAHRALIDAGLRPKVEIWCDGGMKTGEDVVKMILLGANRVGFGTLAMVALGCAICRKCDEGTCHMGIATQIETLDQAKEKGLHVFNPLDYETAVEQLIRLFMGMEEEIRQITARLGATRLQDLVGRGDLLEQVSHQDDIDLSQMFEAVPVKPRPTLEPGVGRLLVRPRNNLTRLLSELITETILEDGEKEITYQDSVIAIDRALGSHIVGALSRRPELLGRIDRLHLRFGPSSIAGNGFSAWVSEPMDITIEGGSQDGTAKGACGGRVAVMKGINHDGLRIDGSVGKSFAYGAQKGIFIVQGNADSRACIRLSGADVILGGEITTPLPGESYCISTHANVKGFACEYMTAGRVLILGDPGPYAFAGMTGGVVYQKLTPEMGFDQEMLSARIALGAMVEIQKIGETDASQIMGLLSLYVEALEQTYQFETAENIRLLCDLKLIEDGFVKIQPCPETSTPVQVLHAVVESLSE